MSKAKKSSVTVGESLVFKLAHAPLIERIKYYSEKNRKPTNSKKIYVPKLDCYMSAPCGNRNKKLGEGILTFDLMAIETCGNCKLCKSTCYARFSQDTRLNVLLKRSLNTYLAKHELPFLEHELIKQISNARQDYTRPHSSGEFISKDYCNLWVRIAKELKNKNFYTYSKMHSLINHIESFNLNNFNVVHSILPDMSLNYDKEEKIKAKAKKYGFLLCPYREGQVNSYHCMKNCFICMHNKYVGFVEHH